ncbi:MAG TPA: FtsW/RodA/SpoVE family cell cycle protein, partial [Opitutaceae bacterium]|nr:FtsW/RodA/SpoVE family cell cycle protein [Opitutaceae bacterium]
MQNPGRDQPRWGFNVNPVTVILVCAAGLCVLGLTVLFSASAYKQDPYAYLNKQLVWLALSVVVCFATSRLDLELVRRNVWVIAGICLLGLALVLIPHIGISVKGSRRWLGLGALRLQISEFAKLAMVFSLSHYLATNQSRLHEFKRGFLVPLGWIGLFCALIIKEPDFGTALLTGTIGIILLFLAGAQLRYLLPTFA